MFKADPLDPARGKRYRDKILRAGGSREELDSLEVSLLGVHKFSIHVAQPLLAPRISLAAHPTTKHF